MSCLKLHWPQTLSLFAPADAEWQTGPESDDAPVILSFVRKAGRLGRNPQRSLLTRARLIHENRCCPECDRASVVPVDSEQALVFRDRMPVPGSGMLVGFECESCGHTWGA